MRSKRHSAARSVLAMGLGVALAGALGCPSSSGPDGGVDAAAAAVSCEKPPDCRAAGFDGVCRQGTCRADARCGDDVECGLGERCVDGVCRFKGCLNDADCATGKCLASVYACAECATHADCPAARPVCATSTGKCLQCKADGDCPAPGPAHCEVAAGACVHCTKEEHCPNGLSCAQGVCRGAGLGQPCPRGVACDDGLMCVNVGQNPQCHRPCGLYTPSCPANELCLKLTFQSSNSLVFDRGEPLGICYAPLQGLRYYREPCTRTAQGHNCQPNLECVPDSPATAVCRGFCNPHASGTCPPQELCHAFPGDYAGHEYGLCYPDTGFGERCAKDAQCRSSLSCTAGDDPTASEDLGYFCHYAVGSAPVLSPCANVLGADGGPLAPDRVCRSGACRGDSTFGAQSYFCFGACESDADCAVGGVRGACDGRFTFAGSNGVSGVLTGCRPACDAASDCLRYGASFTCRVKVEAVDYQSKLHQACAPVAGVRGLGEKCVSDSDCRSGFCPREDARGVSRVGVCLHPCATAAECATPTGLDGGYDGGVGDETGPLSCGQVALLGFKGFDGQPNTYDDRFSAAQLCAGGPCRQDADCGLKARCVPVPDPSAPSAQLVLRCRPVAPAGVMGAGDACSADSDCASGVCADLVAGGRACFGACQGGAGCSTGTTCQTSAVRVRAASGSLMVFDACVK